MSPTRWRPTSPTGAPPADSRPDEKEAQAWRTRQSSIPTSDAPLDFEEHIKPLFREQDRKAMQFAFDLWSPADVSAHAGEILKRLEEGTMPCDGAWPAERVAVFRRWVAQS